MIGCPGGWGRSDTSTYCPGGGGGDSEACAGRRRLTLSQAGRVSVRLPVRRAGRHGRDISATRRGNRNPSPARFPSVGGRTGPSAPCPLRWRQRSIVVSPSRSFLRRLTAAQVASFGSKAPKTDSMPCSRTWGVSLSTAFSIQHTKITNPGNSLITWGTGAGIDHRQYVGTRCPPLTSSSQRADSGLGVPHPAWARIPQGALPRSPQIRGERPPCKGIPQTQPAGRP